MGRVSLLHGMECGAVWWGKSLQQVSVWKRQVSCQINPSYTSKLTGSAYSLMSLLATAMEWTLDMSTTVAHPEVTLLVTLCQFCRRRLSHLTEVSIRLADPGPI